MKMKFLWIALFLSLSVGTVSVSLTGCQAYVGPGGAAASIG